MDRLNAMVARPILSAIYACIDALTDVQECLLPFDGPIDDRINYDDTYDQYVLASARLSDDVVILLDLIDLSMPD
jgi:hypothetical protein